MTVIFWDIQNCTLISTKVSYNSDLIRSRIIESKDGNDEWKIPNEQIFLQSKLYILFAQYDCFTDEQDVLKWWRIFKKFLNQRKQLQTNNPFIQLIASFFTEDATGWKSIFKRYVRTLKIFQQNEHLEEKINILFDIINIGSENIDKDAFQLLSILYSKTHTNSNDPNKQAHHAEHLLHVFERENSDSK